MRTPWTWTEQEKGRVAPSLPSGRTPHVESFILSHALNCKDYYYYYLFYGYFFFNNPTNNTCMWEPNPTINWQGWRIYWPSVDPIPPPHDKPPSIRKQNPIKLFLTNQARRRASIQSSNHLLILYMVPKEICFLQLGLQ